jgi:hypothetical protein
MKRRYIAWILAGVLLVIVAEPFVAMRIGTVRAVARIEALQGRTGDFAELTKSIHTPFTRLESPGDLERARLKMGFRTISNSVVVRFNGEGFPYFYGFVAYDTNKQQVVSAVVDQLW